MAKVNLKQVSDTGQGGSTDPQLRGPIQGPPTPTYEDSKIENEPIDIEGDLPTQTAVPKGTDNQASVSKGENTYSDKDASVASRFATGATPALLSLLFGASPLSAETAIQEGQKRYMAGTPQHLATIIGPEGKPTYDDIRNAPGEEAYIKQLRPMAGGLPKPSKFIDPRDPSKEIMGYYNPLSGTYHKPGVGGQLGEQVVGAYAPTNLSMQGAIGPGGERTTLPINPLTGKAAGPSVQVSPGEAQQKGMGTKEMEQGYKTADEVAKARLPLQAKRADINTSIGLLNSGSSTDQLLGVANTLKNLSQQGLNDKTAQMFTPPGLFQKALDTSNTLVTGNITPEKINDAKQVLIEINKSIDEQDRALTLSYQQAAGGNIVPPKVTPTLGAPPAPEKQLTETQFMSLPKAQRDAIIRKRKGL